MRIAGWWLHWRPSSEGSTRTVSSERMLFDARCRVTNAQILQQRDDEEPGAGDTAAAPLTQRVFRGDAEESDVGDTTSAQPAANG
jgi:pyridoxal/pyridoxine/pyridoxamine kinase